MEVPSYLIQLRHRSLEFPWYKRWQGRNGYECEPEKFCILMTRLVGIAVPPRASSNYETPNCCICYFCKSRTFFQGLHQSCNECYQQQAALTPMESYSYFTHYTGALEFASRSWHPLSTLTKSSLDWMNESLWQVSAPVVPVVTMTRFEKLQQSLLARATKNTGSL